MWHINTGGQALQLSQQLLMRLQIRASGNPGGPARHYGRLMILAGLLATSLLSTRHCRLVPGGFRLSTLRRCPASSCEDGIEEQPAARTCCPCVVHGRSTNLAIANGPPSDSALGAEGSSIAPAAPSVGAASSGVGWDQEFVRVPAAAWAGPALVPSSLRWQPVLNESHSDGLGWGRVVVSTSGYLDAQLVGFGTARITRGCVNSCVAGISLLGPRAVAMRGYFDLRSGYGCSPFAVPLLVNFLREHGERFIRIAVVAAGAPLRIAQLVAAAARFQRIRFFAAAAPARMWLEE